MKKDKLSPAELAKQIVLFDTFDDYDVDDLIAVLQHCDQMYHSPDDTQVSPLNDAQYDALRRYVELAASEHSYFESVGSEVRGGKIRLPFPMGSLTQIYEGEIQAWVKKHQLEASDFIITDKLDAVSGLVIFNKGVLQIAYSRGDGIEGADITRHVKRFKSLPKSIPETDSVAIRGEIILSKKNFEVVRKLVKSRGGTEYKNARNMVAGLMNSSENDPVVYDYLDFVAYEIVGDSQYSKFRMLEVLHEDYNFKVPMYSARQGSLMTDDYLTTYLQERRNSTDYEIDGIVLDVDSEVRRAEMNPTRDTLNPPYALKYKVADAANLAIATVKNVQWNLSKHGYLKPRVNIEPVELVGVTVQYCTGYNAKFIYDNKIGPGAKVRVSRMGDVIPNIVSVVSPMPEENMR